ncbi:TM2 domain-containing protein 1-like [Oopsacas minuta]|uniref:TM2 domain-containing protein 1-like n=1 Tax=Oopsacas minuta TaxID=111878 RepID=A0AAV7K547_9METZ|nr:TM2 domain-containing protein 1-like [Oopsacas minuta]
MWTVILLFTLFTQSTSSYCNITSLYPTQFLCREVVVDNISQSAVNCTSDRIVSVPCYPRRGVICGGVAYDGDTIGFYKNVTCRYVNGTRYHYGVALGLSVFFGFLGLDRFYLGYAAIGLLKFSTMGFFLLGHLVDIILIGLQIVGPADQSDYYIGYWGPVLEGVEIN